MELLEKPPNYAKPMKDILSKKYRLYEFETITLTEECSAFLQNKLPPKLKDLGRFTIPCAISNQFNGRNLCDFRASINLMSLFIYNKLGISEARPTTVALQLADRTLAYLRGIIEDVLVKVVKFIFIINFIVLDYKENRDAFIILGRSFLAIG